MQHLNTIFFSFILLIVAGCGSTTRDISDPINRKAELHYNQGTKKLIEKDYTAALDHLLKAKMHKKNDSKILNNLGMAYYFKKKSVLAELKVLDTQIDLIKSQLSDCKITNPISGIVLEIFIENNEFCITGKPLYKIANLKEIELKAYLSANQLSTIELGKTVQVAIDGSNENLIFYDGKISWISSEAEFTPKIIQTPEDRLNLVYAIKIKVLNDGKIKIRNDGQIKIGMPGELYFNSKQE